MSPEILWLRGGDVTAGEPSAGNLAMVVESASLARTWPPLSIPADDRSGFRARGDVLLHNGLSPVKRHRHVPGNAARGLAEFRPPVLPNETVTGLPIAVINDD